MAALHTTQEQNNTSCVKIYVRPYSMFETTIKYRIVRTCVYITIIYSLIFLQSNFSFKLAIRDTMVGTEDVMEN